MSLAVIWPPWSGRASSLGSGCRDLAAKVRLFIGLLSGGHQSGHYGLAVNQALA